MPLNIISNFAAQVAQRQLAMSDRGASDSVAKISAGTRVLAARDDAAALAIGSRLRAEVAAMTQAGVNAGQAISMLQIADGAMARINDTLVRMKSLAVQAGSDQLGSVERGLIDTEFQQLLLEVDRIATDTEFNGQSLINGGTISELKNAFDPGSVGVANIDLASTVENDAVFQFAYASSTETLTLTKLGVSNVVSNEAQELFDRSDISFAFDSSVASDAVFSYSFGQAGDTFTLTNETTSETITLDLTTAIEDAFGAGGPAAAVPSGESLAVDFASLGVTVTFEQGFDFSSDLTATTQLASANVIDGGNNATETITFGTGLSDAAITALNALIAGGTAGQLALTTTDNGANAGVDIDGLAGIAFQVNGGAIGALGAASATLAENAASTVNIMIDVDGDSTAETTVATVVFSDVLGGQGNGTITVDFNQLASNNQTVSASDNQSVQLDLTGSLDAVAGTGNNLQFDQTLDVAVDQFGVTLTLDKGFDRTTDVVSTIGTTTDSAGTTVANGSFAPESQQLTADVYQALLDLGFDATTGVGYDANTGILSLQVSDDDAANGAGNVTLDGQAGLSFGFGDGNPTGDLNGNGQTVDVSITLANGSSVKIGTLTADFSNAGNNGGSVGAQGTIDITLGRGVFFNQTNEDALQNDFTFKIGTGNNTEDRITLSLNSVNIQALAINGTDVGTAANADASSTAITAAIDTLNNARANVGAFQNRLDIASSNLATARENTEAARSALLDLNVAEEITTFTSKQILVQAGVSMLSQANQLPQNLLRLLQ